ncbi:MAG: hypothetical protein GY679_01830 [Mycoplasma sp.]|nr:hypothetical protein [Mycoplasma sp.]
MDDAVGLCLAVIVIAFGVSFSMWLGQSYYINPKEYRVVFVVEKGEPQETILTTGKKRIPKILEEAIKQNKSVGKSYDIKHVELVSIEQIGDLFDVEGEASE